jgi:DNA uptake protein ComE-like DNA-binding protein
MRRDPGSGDDGAATAEEPVAREAAEASAALAAGERAIAEILALEENFERAQEEASSRIADLEARVAEADARARDAERAREEAERRIQLAEERAAEKVDSELGRETAALEAELAAPHRQLAEAHERLAAASRRADEIETSSRRELEHEQRRRFRLLEPDWKAAREPGPGPGADAAPAFEVPAGTPAGSSEPISLAAASFEDLRGLGMSITQAKRILRYRDERGISDPAELERVPGFTNGYLAAVKDRLVP